MRYFLIGSVVLNAGLLMAVLGPVYFFLYLSILINVGLGWYIYNLIGEVDYVNEDVDNIISSVNGLSDHLESVHELEMFYGEPVIQALIDHMKDVQEEIQSYAENNNMEIVEENAEKIEE